MLQYSLGRPSMLGDFAVDTYNNTSMVQHCEGPWNAWGDERRVPYILTDHRERPIRARGKVGVSAASWILYPPDEPVTMWQIDVQSKDRCCCTPARRCPCSRQQLDTATICTK